MFTQGMDKGTHVAYVVHMAGRVVVPMSDKLTLGERIHAARRRVNASQEELAAALDVSRQLVSKWERDDSVPDLIQVLRLADYTRTTLGWFAEDLIDARDQPTPSSSCNADRWGERPKLFDDEVFFAPTTNNHYSKAS